MRRKRRALSARQQREAALSVGRQLITHPWLLSAERIGLYLSNDGELDPQAIAQRLWRMRKQCYLPILHPGSTNKLWFGHWQAGSRLINNRFGIPEPAPSLATQAKHLDLILIPLVAFDAHGNRMGMGGGFYDRTLAFRQHRPHGSPKLVGLAHECQRVESLPVESWDVPLDAILTDRAWYLD